MPSRTLRLLYVMDPPAWVLVDKDTTYAFMVEGERRGHAQHACGVEDLFVDGVVPHARVRRVQVRRGEPPSLFEERTVPLTWFDVVFMRKDPPFDLGYFFATHVLGLADPTVTFVVNDPRGLREANDQTTILAIPTWWAVALMVPSFALFSATGFYTAWRHWCGRHGDAS